MTIEYTPFDIKNYKNIDSTKPIYVCEYNSGINGNTIIRYHPARILTTEVEGDFPILVSYNHTLSDMTLQSYFSINGKKESRRKPCELVIGSHFLINGWMNMYSNHYDKKLYKTEEEAINNIVEPKYSTKQVGSTYDERFEEYMSFDPQYDDTIEISYYKKDRGF